MNLWALWVFLCVSFFVAVEGDIYGSKEWVTQTKGEVWPKVQDLTTSNQFFKVNQRKLALSGKRVSVPRGCHLVRDAVKRALQNVFASNQLHPPWRPADNSAQELDSPKYLGELTTIQVNLTGACDDKAYPSLNMTEEYTLEVSTSGCVISSNSTWGILRGLETFSQLAYITTVHGNIYVNRTRIHDWPRYPHRGLLLDTSRHYIPVADVLRTLDAMSYNKLNVFHWHLTDLQSFPYQSYTYPELSEKGAWHPVYAVYTQADVRTIIEYARKRGIRVLPEFDTPGHTASWGDSHKELLTACYEEGRPTGHYGPLDVTKNSTYTLVGGLLREVSAVFPDEYMHIGGDEVDFDCWASNPEVNEFMSRQLMGSYVELESYYVRQVIDLVHSFPSKSIVWEEVFTNGVEFPQSTIVQVWKSEDPQSVMNAATAAGRRVILSACWYLDTTWSPLDWATFYKCDPGEFGGSDAQRRLVLGGEVALWAEYVDGQAVDGKLWPRGAAGAERLWSDVTVGGIGDYLAAAARLEEHLCRLKRRGVRAQPASGPNYCL